MRINKYIAKSGVCSRRKADELIAAGKVEVNGLRLTEPGYDVQPGDVVHVDGNELELIQKTFYYAMNKPTGVITAVSDDKGRPTVCDLLENPSERVFPVGRLDMNTSGLLFLTNDGDFAYALTHPRHEIEKTYIVRVAGNIPKEKIARLRSGVDIGGFVTSRARVDVVTWNRHSMVLSVTIHEGKNRQVRRMFEAVGYPVQQLERVQIGNIKLGHIKPGHTRQLSPSEVEGLLRAAGSKKNKKER
jgi:23S rRNA pseudouridine2605 synthase